MDKIVSSIPDTGYFSEPEMEEVLSLQGNERRVATKFVDVAFEEQNNTIHFLTGYIAPTNFSILLNIKNLNSYIGNKLAMGPFLQIRSSILELRRAAKPHDKTNPIFE